ncbi:MAG: hypothetical protein OXN25_19805 [Candidatus Poribacteria bacterium]|nr:hypothetical protein [Candidatus Poribacteria bacterium]
MAIFYRGAGIGTYWHLNNPLERGFIARSPGMESTTTRLMDHIARSTVNSPFISLTRSYGVAWHYAMSSSTRPPTSSQPAYVHEIEIQEPLPRGLKLLDPVKEVVQTLALPTEPGPPYQHDGLPSFLIGIVDPGNMEHFLAQRAMQPPTSEGIPRTPNLTIELETLVRALRDSEILVHGIIPATCVKNSFDVYPELQLSE